MCELVEYSDELSVVGAFIFSIFMLLTLFFLFFGRHDNDRFALLKWAGFRKRYLTPNVLKTRNRVLLFFAIAWTGGLLMQHEEILRDLELLVAC